MRRRPAALLLVISVATAGGAPAVGASAAPAAVTCDGRLPTIVGTEGFDELTGTNGPDVIAGLGGWDSIDGLGGDDVLCGGEGTDVLVGGDGDDRLFGGLDAPGNVPGDTQRSGDSLSGGPGNDWLDPGHDPRHTRGSAAEDHEVVTYQAAGPVRVDLGTGPALGTVTGDGVDTIVLSPTRLRIIGSQHSDTFLGSFRPDWFDGQGGSDVIDGRGGDDHLLADGGDRPTPGDDRVAGGDGDDFLQSHDGRDRLIGGPGADQLRTTSRGATRLLGGAGPDRLRSDLNAAGQRIAGGPGADVLLVDQFGVRETTIDQHKGIYRASKQRESVRGRIDGITEFELGFGRYRFLGSGRDEIVRALRSRGLTANGRGGDDVLTGSRKRADVLDGGGGTDRLDGDPHEDVCVDGERGSCVP